MKFFVDTADVGEIKLLTATGLLDGVTTNPSLVQTERHSSDAATIPCCCVIAP